jgi:hypothetical protein
MNKGIFLKIQENLHKNYNLKVVKSGNLFLFFRI